MELSLLLSAVEVGHYISAWKCLPLLFVLLLWGRLITWIDKDAPAAHLPRIPVNLGTFSAGVIGFALFFFIPGFWAAFGVLLLAIAIAVGVYLGIRHTKVGLGDLSTQFTKWIKSFSPKCDKEVEAVAGELQLFNQSGSLQAAPDAESPDLAAYNAIQHIFTEPLQRNAEQVDLVPSGGGMAMSYTIDGVTYKAPDVDRSDASAAIMFLKKQAGLDLNDRRKPQTGKMKISINREKRELKVQTAGSNAGEFLRIITDPKARHGWKLDQIGLLEDQEQLVRASIAENKGIVLVSAPKTQGLTSLMYALIRAHDAFMTHIHTVERAPEAELEGITQNALTASASPAEEFKQVSWVVSQDPDVIMVGLVEDPRSAQELLKHAVNGKRVYVGLRAGSTFDALTMWRKMIGDDRQAMKHLAMIISGRLFRKLCQACKQGYAPDPGTLRKLNMDPESVGKLYQARTTPLTDSKGNEVPCQFCQDLRFKGRMGVYEVFMIDDEVRQLVQGGASVNQLKAAFRKQHGRFLQEAALVRVQEGETSVQEVLRVLRAGTEGGNPPPAPAGGGAGPGAPRSPARPPSGKPTVEPA